MDIDKYISGAELVIPALVVLAFSLQKWRAGMSDEWRKQAESYKETSEEWAEELRALRAEVRDLMHENAELRAEVHALREENAELRDQIQELLGR
jgi:uncharacterized coiled-coil DUF342 family protein